MRKGTGLMSAAAAAIIVLHGWTATGARPAAAAARTDGQDATTLDDQVDLAVTVYNSDIALVRDVRNVRLAPGEADLRFMDIAATVNPATVHMRSLTDPAQLSVLEQNYEYDLLEPDKLLRKYVGRDVVLVRRRTENGVTREDEEKAHLSGIDPAFLSGSAAESAIIKGKRYATPTVWGDADRLKQVLLNLLINAIQASPNGSDVLLTARQEDAKVFIQVKDGGCGIAPENREKIFDPFFTTKESGTGLGLSVAHQIIEQHGGILTAEANPDRGTTFSVVLPLKRGAF